MYRINIKALAIDKGLDFGVIASVLFPTNLYPLEALERLAEGKGELKESQIIALCKLTGEDPTNLFTKGWKGKVGEGVLIFSRDGFKAVFNPTTRATAIFKDSGVDRLVHEFVTLGQSVSINEYVTVLDEEINKLK